MGGLRLSHLPCQVIGLAPDLVFFASTRKKEKIRPFGCFEIPHSRIVLWSEITGH